VSTEDQISIEDRVRIATKARASLVRELRPLPAPGLSPLRHQGAPRSLRWLTWGIPLTAAATVVALALSLVFVRQHGTVPAKPSVLGSQFQSATQGTGIPRYYVALISPSSGDGYALLVADDRTGAAIATVAEPHGVDFIQVTGTADDRTFLVYAWNSLGTRSYLWYLVHVVPGAAHPAQLTKLPVPGINAITAALSPDGRELAVESQSSVVKYPDLGDNRFTLALYSVTSGAKLRSWTTPANLPTYQGLTNLTWLADGMHLAFGVSAGPETAPAMQVRSLDMTAQGTNLLTASRVLVTMPQSGPAACFSAQVTPDGGTVVCGTRYNVTAKGGSPAGCARQGPGFTVYSARTGKLVRVLYRYPGPCTSGQARLLWLDASATHVIGAVLTGAGLLSGQLGVITKAGGFQAVRLAKEVTVQDYSFIAF